MGLAKYTNRVKEERGIRAVLLPDPIDYIWVDGTRYDRAEFDFSAYRLLEQAEAINLLGGVDAYLDFERVGCRMFWDSYYQTVCSIGTGNPFESIEDVFSSNA